MNVTKGADDKRSPARMGRGRVDASLPAESPSGPDDLASSIRYLPGATLPIAVAMSLPPADKAVSLKPRCFIAPQWCSPSRKKPSQKLQAGRRHPYASSNLFLRHGSHPSCQRAVGNPRRRKQYNIVSRKSLGGSIEREAKRSICAMQHSTVADTYACDNLSISAKRRICR